jgi:hypothetical protein
MSNFIFLKMTYNDTGRALQILDFNYLASNANEVNIEEYDDVYYRMIEESITDILHPIEIPADVFDSNNKKN